MENNPISKKQQAIIERYAQNDFVTAPAKVLVSEYSRRIAHELDTKRATYMRALDEMEADKRLEDERIARFLNRPHEELMLDAANYEAHYAAALELLMTTETSLSEMGGAKKVRRLRPDQKRQRGVLLARKEYAATLVSVMRRAIARRNIAFSKYHKARTRTATEYTEADAYLYDLMGVVIEALRTNSLFVLRENQGLLDGINEFWARKGVDLINASPNLVWSDLGENKKQ